MEQENIDSLVDKIAYQVSQSDRSLVYQWSYVFAKLIQETLFYGKKKFTEEVFADVLESLFRTKKIFFDIHGWRK